MSHCRRHRPFITVITTIIIINNIILILIILTILIIITIITIIIVITRWADQGPDRGTDEDRPTQPHTPHTTTSIHHACLPILITTNTRIIISIIILISVVISIIIFIFICMFMLNYIVIYMFIINIISLHSLTHSLTHTHTFWPIAVLAQWHFRNEAVRIV